MFKIQCASILSKVSIGFVVVLLLILTSLPALVQADTISSNTIDSLKLEADSLKLEADSLKKNADFLTQKADSLEQALEKSEGKTWWVGLSVFFLIMIFLFLGFYLVYLRREFGKICREGKKLTEFIKAPAGVPQGTIRSILTLIIVTFSLFLIILVAFGITEKFPEVLTAILSAVIGFYFGNRAASMATETTNGELERTVQQRNEALEERDKGKAAEIFKKLNKGIALAKTVTDLLPEDLKKKHQGTLEKLERGAEAAKDLLNKGNLESAIKAADEVFGIFKKENPFRGIVSKALSSIGKITGIAASPMSIISTVVGIGTTLTGGAYARWKARILNSPFSPSVVPLKTVDADTGIILIDKCPILKEAFQEKLDAKDRPFFGRVAIDFISQETPVLLKKKEYLDHFDSQEDFENGLQEFRKLLATVELISEIDPALLTGVGDSKTLMATIDKIEKDEEARGDLGLLVKIIEGLQEANEPVKNIFDKIRKEMES